MPICPHEHYGHCRSDDSVECKCCEFNPEKKNITNSNERLDISDYLIPDGVCPEIERKCTWIIKGKCTIPNKFQCPKW